MSFVRSKEIKGHTYYYLVESVREGKKVRQKHIRYLGKTASGANKSELGTTHTLDEYRPKERARSREKESRKWGSERKRRSAIVAEAVGCSPNTADKLIARAEGAGVAWDRIDWDAIQGKDLTYSERVAKLDAQIGRETRTKTETKRASKKLDKSRGRVEALNAKERLTDDEKEELEAVAYDEYLSMKAEKVRA